MLLFPVEASGPDPNGGTATFRERYRFDSADAITVVSEISPSGDGLISVIASNRPYNLVSIKHLGYVKDGVDDATSEEVRSWAPSYEKYLFTEIPGGIQVMVEQEITPDVEQYMRDTWPQALASHKALCETDG